MTCPIFFSLPTDFPSSVSAEKNPPISYIIATGNRRDDIEDMTDSILAQQYEAIETIAITSVTDGTADLFKGDQNGT